MNIGTLTLSKDGGWNGTIHTLSLDTKIRLVPNDNRTSEKSPAFRIFTGATHIGDAWEASTTKPGMESPKIFYRLSFDDPCLPSPFNAALFPSGDGTKAALVWSRRREG